MHVHYMTMPQHMSLCPGIMKIKKIGRLFLGHKYYTLYLSDICLSEEKILKEIKHFPDMTYLATP